MESIIAFIAKHKKILLPAVAVFLVAVIILIIWLSRGSSMFDPDADVYNRVQIKVTENVLNPEYNNESLVSGTDDTESESSELQNGYYDEFGSFIPDTQQETEEQESEYDLLAELKIKKDGDILYLEGFEEKAYYYSKDGQKYILYYDDMYGMKKDNGDWVERAVDEYTAPLFFDFNLLKSIDTDRLNKSGKEYVPDEEYLTELFCLIMRIEEQNIDNYTVDSLSLKFDKNKLRTIKATYIYNNQTTEYLAEFTYNNTALKVPQVDRLYGEEN